MRAGSSEEEALISPVGVMSDLTYFYTVSSFEKKYMISIHIYIDALSGLKRMSSWCKD